jgi:hypothetical protein
MCHDARSDNDRVMKDQNISYAKQALQYRTEGSSRSVG